MLLHKSVVNDSRVLREAEALTDAGHEVTVVELAAVDPAAGRFHRVSALPPRWVRRGGGTAIYRAAFVTCIIAQTVRRRPEVIHAHDAAMLLPGFIAAGITGASLVYDSHELATGVPYHERGWHWFVESLERMLVPRCAAVITVSDSIADRLHSKYALLKRPAVVRNLCSLSLGHAPVGLRTQLDLGDEPLVLHQGAAARDRGCDVLLDAVADMPGTHLCFLGDGDEQTVHDLREQAATRGIGDRVHFLATVPPERLLELTSDADVGVSLLQDTCENHRFALPNKLFEYLAASVPVVVSDLPEMRRLVDGFGVGWCAHPSDSRAVADALRLALGHRGDVALHNRVDHASRELSWESESSVLTGLYDALPVPTLA